MIQRFSQQFVRLFYPGFIPATYRPGVNFPEVDRKTKADVRREILGKLAAQMAKLDVSKRCSGN
jgi:hypothetical protein